MVARKHVLVYFLTHFKLCEFLTFKFRNCKSRCIYILKICFPFFFKIFFFSKIKTMTFKTAGRGDAGEMAQQSECVCSSREPLCGAQHLPSGAYSHCKFSSQILESSDLCGHLYTCAHKCA